MSEMGVQEATKKTRKRRNGRSAARGIDYSSTRIADQSAELEELLKRASIRAERIKVKEANQ